MAFVNESQTIKYLSSEMAPVVNILDEYWNYTYISAINVKIVFLNSVGKFSASHLLFKTEECFLT